MPREQELTYNFDAINTLGAKPKLAYIMAKSPWSQSLLFIFSLCFLITPIGGLFYAIYFNLALMQNIFLALSFVGVIQYFIVQDFFETIKYISHAENCRQKQVLGCQKIQSLNETIASNGETIRQKREETSDLLEQNDTLHKELESVKTVLNDHATKDSQSARIVSELSEAIKKVVRDLPDNQADLYEIKYALDDFSKALRDHGGKVNINGQHYAALKGLLLKISATPHNYHRYSQLSEQTIKNLERKNLYLADIIQKIQNAAVRAQATENTDVSVSPQFKQSNIILDIHHLSTQTILALDQHKDSQTDKEERTSLARDIVDTSNPMMQSASMFQQIGAFVGLSPTKGPNNL